MKTNSKQIKTQKSFEEYKEDGLCNYQGGNTIDLSDEKTNPGTAKSRNTLATKSEEKSKNELSAKKKTGSKKSSRKNSAQSNENIKIYTNSTVLELVDSLKEKLNLYENEIRCLIEEKVEMQVQINSLQLNSFQNLKKEVRRIIEMLFLAVFS